MTVGEWSFLNERSEIVCVAKKACTLLKINGFDCNKEQTGKQVKFNKFIVGTRRNYGKDITYAYGYTWTYIGPYTTQIFIVLVSKIITLNNLELQA